MKTTIAATVFMIRPKHFGYNEQTALSNSFQNRTNQKDTADKVQMEFDYAVVLLRNEGIEVIVFDDVSTPLLPDAIFPNNWISINNNLLILYPMLALNRRQERRKDLVDFFITRYPKIKVIDLSYFEEQNKFCEGTGSIVFDHKNKVAYASLSPRTDKEVVEELCHLLNYKPILFKSFEISGNPIYHTNVMMCVADTFAVVCKSAIHETERNKIINQLESDGHVIIEITLAQMKCFAGNMLQLQNNQGQKFIIMSETSHKSLSLAQLNELKQHVKVLVTPVGTIEFSGGGSIRCMLAEVFS